MITLTITVPTPGPLITAGYGTLQLTKSGNHTAAGTYANVAGATAALDPAITSYTLIDPAGTPGDWYETVYTGGSGTSGPSQPQPGYLSDLNNTIRDLLGVTTNEVSDSQIQGFAYLPAALGRIRQRLATFDTVVATGGDLASLCLGALAHLAAALLCPRMTVMVVDSEQFDKYKYQRNRQMDWTATQAELFAQYEILISQAAQETDVPQSSYVPGVVLAGPSRSGNDNDGGLVPFVPDPFENPLLPYNPDLNPD